MFWKGSCKDCKSSDGKKSKIKTNENHRSFHTNPNKSWGYYNRTSQSELTSLIVAKKQATASTSESYDWSYTLKKFMYDQDSDAMDVVDEDEDEQIIYTPEGITRIPFTTWEVDHSPTARLSSYFQRAAYSGIQAHRYPHRLDLTTPQNSPHPHP